MADSQRLTKTQADVLACLEMNVSNARTKGLREFAEKQLADYKTSLQRSHARKKSAPPSFEKFLKHLETDHP